MFSSLCTYVGLFSHMWVSFDIFGTLLTCAGLFSHMWVSFDMSGSFQSIPRSRSGKHPDLLCLVTSFRIQILGFFPHVIDQIYYVSLHLFAKYTHLSKKMSFGLFIYDFPPQKNVSPRVFSNEVFSRKKIRYV